MNYCLMDSGFLYALFDNSDLYSLPVRKCLGKIRGEIIIPVPAVIETAYFIRKNLGQDALGDFAEDLSNMDVLFEAPTIQDYYRTSEVLRKYKDSNLDFVNACIFAIAECLTITKILTVDRRHFGMFRPKHCDTFEILP